MAEFYGTLIGKNNSIATKTGTKSSGITAAVQSWEGSIITSLSKGPNDKLMVQVSYLNYSGASMGDLIFYGTFEEYVKLLKRTTETTEAD